MLNYFIYNYILNFDISDFMITLFICLPFFVWWLCANDVNNSSMG